MHTVKVGDKCWYSSTFGGLIEVKYVGIKEYTGTGFYHPKEREAFEVVKDNGVFRKGEIIWNKTYVTPKAVFKKTGRFTYFSTGDYVYENKIAEV